MLRLKFKSVRTLSNKPQKQTK